MYIQTDVGLLCCVGSGSNVAVPKHVHQSLTQSRLNLANDCFNSVHNLMSFLFTFVNAKRNIYENRILSFLFFFGGGGRGTGVERLIADVLTTVATKTIFMNDATYLVDS
jgi:hypothetical protein